MSTMSLSEHFHEYFEIILANTKELKEASYKIRHQVYSEELGWEPSNPDRMETDEFDHYSVPLLLRHRRSNQYAGTLRLVTSSPNAPENKLPFEAHGSQYLWPHVIDNTKLERGNFSEVSRLAIPNQFRRRKGEKDSPNGIADSSLTTTFNEEEKRFFPFIGLGLYLGASAITDIYNHAHVFGLFETKLEKRLLGLGFKFRQCGEETEYHHGKRALYYITHDDLIFDNPQIDELYQSIGHELNKQLLQSPHELDTLISQAS